MGVLDEIAAELVASELATEVVYRRADESNQSLRVVWSEGYKVEMETPGVNAVAFSALADLEQPPVKGDLIERDGRVYRVSEDPSFTRDGQGGVRLLLRVVQ